jgi:hypothetical protein
MVHKEQVRSKLDTNAALGIANRAMQLTVHTTSEDQE